MKSGTFFKIIALIFSMAITGIGCSEDATDGASTSGSLSISGSLGGAGAASQKLGILAVTDYKIRCVTLEGTPKAGEATVGADGSFTLAIDGVTSEDNVAVGCFIINVNTSAIAATIAFDTGSAGMGGSTAASGSVTAAGGEGLSFGEINFDPDKGTATVPVSQITRSGNTRTTAGTFADVSGNWLFDCVVSSDYDCPEDAVQGNFIVHLDQISVTDDVAAAHTGLAIWDSEQFVACGQTEDLDNILPAGWAATNTALNANFSFPNTLPAASSIQVGYPVCEDNTATTCNQVTNGGTAEGSNNTDGWGAPAGGFLSDLDCQAICQLNGLYSADWGTNVCMPRVEVNWPIMWGASPNANLNDPGEIATEIGSWNGTTTTNALVTAEDSPDGRFVIGEMIIDGKVGTVLDSKAHNAHICIDNGTGCDDFTCIVRENVRVTITQLASTTAIVEVAINRALDDAASPEECETATAQSGNWVADEVSQTEKFLMTATKQ